MALKDWTKISKKLWVKDSYLGNYEVWVYQGRVNEKIMWIVSVKEIGMGGYTRHFKTKSEALAYAKSYMRTH